MATDLSLSSFNQFIELVNQENSIELPVEKISLSNPTELVDDIDSKNTQVTISAIPNSGLLGSVSVKYNRMNLNEFQIFGGEDPIVLYMGSASTFNDLVAQFNTQFGANISIGVDIVNKSINTPVDEPQSILFESLPNSLAWIGSIGLEYALSTIPLASIIETTNVPGLVYFDAPDLSEDVTNSSLLGFKYSQSLTTQPTSSVGAQYTYGIDFTTQYSVLSTFTAGTVLSQAQGTTIVNAISYCDLDGARRLTWKSATGVTSTDALYNLHGATVVYNGINNDITKPTNKAFSRVMELSFKTGVTAPIGNIYLHYNLPVDPLVATNPNVEEV